MTGRERFRDAFQNGGISPLCRGEVWLGEQVFQAARFKDDLEGHLRLCCELGMDIVSLSLSESPPTCASYRYFKAEEITQISGDNRLAIVTVIDGPFQRLANKMGLMRLLTSLISNPAAVREGLVNEVNAIHNLILATAKSDVEAVVIADDIAYGQSTYLSQTHFRDFLLPCYTEIIALIHSVGYYGLFHSDGNVSTLISDLVAIGFDGINCQSEHVDLPALKSQWGQQLTIWGGLDQEFLDAETGTPGQTERLLTMVKSLARGGKFILGSSSGLFLEKHLQGIKSIYQVVSDI